MAFGIYTSEDVELTFSANMIRADYGVPGSPSWDEPEDVELDAVAIFGVPVDVKALREHFPALHSEIMARSYEIEEWQ